MARKRAVCLFLFAVALLLVTSAGSAAPIGGPVTATLKCDHGLEIGAGEVWLLASLPSSRDDMVANNVGHAVLPQCGEAHGSFKTTTTITPTGTWAFVHVEFAGMAFGSSGRRFLCILGFPGLGFVSDLPIRESCPVVTDETREPSVRLTVR